jgi:MFS transporter, ACS family, solute carrier family 17 (sodium-dependent inorganic phosphate cotransporter), other
MPGKSLDGTNAWPHRYTVVLACSFALLIAYVDRVNISVAALAMQRQFGWTESVKGTVLASYFVGYVFMQVVGGWLAHRFGGERVLVVSLFTWSICTALTPFFAHLWFPLLLAVRIGLGVGEGPLNPAAFNIFARNVPAQERARAVAFFAGSGYVGNIVALVSTGALITRYGWESAFYLFGAIGLIYTIILPRLLGDTTRDVAKHDTRSLLAGEPVPWTTLLRLGPFWALTFAFFCTCWVFYVLLLWMPSYFSRAYGLKISSTGLYSLAPWLVMIVVQNLAGWFSDRILRRGASVTMIRKVLTGVGMFGTGAMLMTVHSAATAPQALLLLCVAMGFLALAFTGEVPNVFDIAPRYADVLFSILNTFGTVPGIVGVWLTGLLVQATHSFDSSLGLAGALTLLGGTVYLIFGTGRQLLD